MNKTILTTILVMFLVGCGTVYTSEYRDSHTPSQNSRSSVYESQDGSVKVEVYEDGENEVVKMQHVL